MKSSDRLDKSPPANVQPALDFAEKDALKRSTYHRQTKTSSAVAVSIDLENLDPAHLQQWKAALRIQAFVRACQARDAALHRLEGKHTAQLLARGGRNVRGSEYAWVSVLQFAKSDDWVVRLEEAQGTWRLEAKVGLHHPWRLYSLSSIIEGVDLTEDNQMVLNSQERRSTVISKLQTETPVALFCKRQIRLARKVFWLTAKVERNILTLAIEGSIRDKFKPLSLTTAFSEYTMELLEEEVERLLPRLTLHNQALVLGTEKDKAQVSIKLTNRPTISDVKVVAAGRRRIAGCWYTITVTLRQQERLNTMLALYELEARADQPSDVCLTREYQLSELLGKLNLWTAAEVASMGEELLDHVQLDTKSIDFTREKTGTAATKQELLRVTKTLSNKFDYELVFLYDVALPSNLTIEAKGLENSPPIDHPLDLDLAAIREQAQLTSAQLNNEDLGKLVDMVDIQEGELALLQRTSAAPLPTIQLREEPKDLSFSQVDVTKSKEQSSVQFTEAEIRAILRVQAYFRMKLAQRSWEPIKNPSQNLVLRRSRRVRGQSYLISACKTASGLHLEALRLSDSRVLTKDISHPAAYAFGYSKLEDLQLLFDGLTESGGRLGLRKGKRPGKSGSSINISELDISFFRDLEEEKDQAARRITHFFRCLMFRKRFHRLVESTARKMLMCKKKDLGSGMSLISIFQEENELTVEICEPVRERSKPWKVQRMKLDLTTLGVTEAPLELLLEHLKVVNGTLQTTSLSDMSPLLLSGEEPDKERRRQLLTRVRTFEGKKVVVTATLVQPLPMHVEPKPTDLLEFELVPSLTDPPSQAVITIQEAAERLGLPVSDLIPIANLTISKLLRVRNSTLEIESDLPSPVIDMQEIASSIQATARGFLVRFKYRDLLRQLKSYLVAMTEMQFFQQPYIVYAYHLEDKYKIEAVHRISKVNVMLMIDEGLVRRFKFGGSRKQAFEEAVFPRLFMVEDEGLLRLCLNHRVGSERPSTRSLRSTLTDYEVTLAQRKTEEVWSQPTQTDTLTKLNTSLVTAEMPAPSQMELSISKPSKSVPLQRPPIVPRLENIPTPVQPTPPSHPVPTTFQPGPPLPLAADLNQIRERIYHLDVVVKTRKDPLNNTTIVRGNSAPSDEIRRIRRLQASMKRSEGPSFSNLHESQSHAQLSRPPIQSQLSPSASQLFIKTYVPALRQTAARSMSTQKVVKASKPTAPRKELIFKTGHHISDYFCVVSFFRLKRSCLLIEAIDSRSNQKYACKVTIDPTLAGPALDAHCEELLESLQVVRGKEGWKLGVKSEDDHDFFVV